MKSKDPSLLALLGFASPAFAVGALGLPISVILPPLYAELGLSLTVVGTVFMIARIFDGVTDPIFGIVGDRIQTRWGRRRPAMIAALPPLLLGVWLLFFPSGAVTPTGLLIAMVILYVGWTLYTLAHTAWASELSDDYDGRSKIMSYLQYFGLAGMIAVLLTPVFVDLVVEDATMVQRAAPMGALILFTLPAFSLVALLSIKEPPLEQVKMPPWRDTFKIFARSAALRRLLIADLLAGFQGGVNGAVHFFFVIHVLLMPAAASLFIVVIFVAGFFCVPIFLKLSMVLNKHRALCIGSIFQMAATIMLLFLPPEAFVLTFVVYMMIGANMGANTFLMRSMMADIVEVDERTSGAKRSALFYSLLTLTPKLGAALAVGLVFPMLDWVQFDPTVVNTPEVLQGVRYVVTLTPITAAIGILWALWNYPLSRSESGDVDRDGVDPPPILQR
ncbi:MAG: MFS transporter [Pseudomonadota bacterium]